MTAYSAGTANDAATAATARAPAVTNADGCPASPILWTTIFVAFHRGATSPSLIALYGWSTVSPSQSQGETVSVHGRPALLTRRTGPPYEQWTLTWNEAELSLTMTGTGVSRDDMVRIAESVERVDDDEWNQATPPPSLFSPTQSPPNFAEAIELARLTTPSGQLIRLLHLSDPNWLCIEAGTTRGCGSETSVRPPDGIARVTMTTGSTSGRFGAILLPANLPTDIELRRSSGETVQSTRSNDGRYLLFAEADSVANYEIIDTAGQVVARVDAEPFSCPPSATANCSPPTTTR